VPGTIIKVSPRTAYSWKAVPQATATGETIIQPFVPVWQWREISVLVRVHVTTTGSAGSKITVKVVSSPPTDEEPNVLYGTGAIATIDIATGTGDGTVVKLDVSPQSSTPVNAGSHLGIIIYATGATSGVTDVTATLSVDLVCKS
jgi:hypothetical protein